QNRRQHRIAPVRDRGHFHHRPAVSLHHQVSGKIAEGLFSFELLGGYFSLDNYFSLCRNFEWNCFATDDFHGPPSDSTGHGHLVKAIGKSGRRHIVDVRQRPKHNGDWKRFIAPFGVGIVIEHGVMRRADASQQAIRRPEVPAVHSYVANTALVIACNKRTCHPRVTAETWLLHRSGNHSQADFFQLRTHVNFFLHRTIFHRYRLDGLSPPPPPALIHVGGIDTPHAQADDFARSSVDSGKNLNPVTAPVAVDYVFIQKCL